MPGRTCDAVAKEWASSRKKRSQRLSPAGGIYFRMDEADVQRILQYGKTMIGSDGLPHDAAPHPRLWGTFPRVLGHYGRLLGLFPLETAVYKMTGLTAKNFGLKDRGVLREGAFADLTLFDADTVDAAATYEKPIAPARGIDTVIVNGGVVWQRRQVHRRASGPGAGARSAGRRKPEDAAPTLDQLETPALLLDEQRMDTQHRAHARRACAALACRSGRTSRPTSRSR